MIVGTGTDLVDVERLGTRLAKVPGLARRLFTEAELEHCAGRPASLAARFAAKEAVLKALGSALSRAGASAPPGWSLRQIEVPSPPGTPPVLVLGGGVLEASRRLGVRRWHVSLSHTGGLAQAFVVAED